MKMLLSLCAALCLCACNSVATGSRFTAPSTESIATRISSAASAVQRGQVRAQRIQAAVAVPVIRPEQRDQLVRDAGDLGTDLAEATKQLEAATAERSQLRDAVEAQTVALNTTISERDQARSERDSSREQVRELKGEISTLNDRIKAESGWWARLKHNAVLCGFAFIAGLGCAWLLRLAGGAAVVAARVGLRVALAACLVPLACAVTILRPMDGSTFGGTVGHGFSLLCRSDRPATWSATNLPPGLIITGGGAIYGVPEESGTWEVFLLAQDLPGTPEPEPAEATITIVIDEPLRALPEATPIAPKAPREVR